MTKIFDTTSNAFVEMLSKIHNDTIGAWVDAPSAKTYDKDLGAWVERLKHYVENITSQGLIGRLDIEETSISTTFSQTSSYETQQVEFYLPKVRNGDEISFDYSTELQASVVILTKKGGYHIWGPSGTGSIPLSGTASFQVNRTDVSFDEGVLVRIFRISQGQTSFPEVDGSISNLTVKGIKYYFK